MGVMVWCHGVGVLGGDKDLLGCCAFRVGRGSQADYGASLENW